MKRILCCTIITTAIVALVMMPFAMTVSAVTVGPILQPHQTFVDNSGSPCSLCLLYTYAAGTMTPQATYTDASGTVQNTNPITLDTAGGANIWLGSNAYKFVLKDSLGSTIWTVDNVYPIATQAQMNNFVPVAGGTMLGTLHVQGSPGIDNGSGGPPTVATGTPSVNQVVSALQLNAGTIPAYVTIEQSGIGDGIYHPGTCANTNKPSYCSGSTPDAWIQSAINAAESAGGGVVDFSGFGAGSSLTFSAAVNVGDGIHPIRLVGNRAINLIPGSNGINMFNLAPGSSIEHVTFNLNTIYTYTGNLINLASGFYSYNQNTRVDDIYINADNGSGSAVTSGNGLLLFADTGFSIQFVSVSNFQCFGMGSCVTLKNSGTTGYVNGNYFSSITATDSGYGIQLITAGANSVDSNMFVNITYQQSGHSLGGIFLNNATGSMRFNQFINYTGWDTTSVPPIKVTNTSTMKNNYFSGRWDGTISDATGINKYNDIFNSAETFGNAWSSSYFVSSRNSVSCASASATTVFSFQNQSPAAYLVVGNIGITANAAATYSSYAVILTDGSTAVIANAVNGANQTLTLSGLNLQMTQSSGITRSCTISVTRIN